MLTLTRSLPIDAPGNDTHLNGYAVRACTATDAEQLAVLYYEAYDPGEACDSLQEATRDIHATFAGEYGRLLKDASLVTISSAGQMCAAVLVVERAPWEDTPSCPFIVELFTARGHRRRGLAADLLARSSQVLAAAGHAAFALRVVADNTVAVELYRYLGFRPWNPAFRIEHPVHGCRDVVQTILADLPEWFGHPDSTAAYITAADTLGTYSAITPTGEQMGVALVEQHFPRSAEVHLIAVKAEWHRRGVGRALLHTLEADLRIAGTQMLTVKTLGSSHPDEGYRRTRGFYEGMGFIPLEEFTDLWPGTPCLYLVKALT